MQGDFHMINKTISGFLALFLLILPAVATGQTDDDTYRFERMWPVFQQPWYFMMPTDVAIGGDGNVYVADKGNHRIVKMSPDGRFLTSWGGLGFDADGNIADGEDPGRFKRPDAMAFDSQGNLYVADVYQRIQKFTADGAFATRYTLDPAYDYIIGMAGDDRGNVYLLDPRAILVLPPDAEETDVDAITVWAAGGTAAGVSEFGGIAVDEQDNVYATDVYNERVLKFSPDGVLLATFSGGDDGLGAPHGLAVAPSGDIYVAGTADDRIRVLNATGELIHAWGETGQGSGEFHTPEEIAVGSDGRVYVADSLNHRIQKFDADGRFIAAFGNAYSGAGQFFHSSGIAFDPAGDLWVADFGNHRIQKFTAEGDFLGAYPVGGDDSEPMGIDIDDRGNIYVAEGREHRILVLNAQGRTIREWGRYGYGDDEFIGPTDVAIDSNGDVFVCDHDNRAVKKFTADGRYLDWSIEDGIDLESPTGVAIGPNDILYVLDRGTPWVKIFAPDGRCLARYGDDWRSEEGQFILPYGIAADASGNFYVAGEELHRVQKFSFDPATRQVRHLATFGTPGHEIGQFSGPRFLCVGPDGERVYVSDTANNRVQIFRQGGEAITNGGYRAIIVAGSGPYPGNHLWNATRACANDAYRSLMYQGYTRNTIRYLSADRVMDQDGDGLPDADNVATNDALRQAVTEWAANAADNLLLYLVGHGDDRSFRMGQSEILTASNLDAWLDDFQRRRPGNVVVVYDACKSGSFLPILSGSTNRTLVASADSGEDAYFIAQGAISFSNFFWRNVLYGDTLANAFESARFAMNAASDRQHPLLDSDGDGVPNQPSDTDALGEARIGIARGTDFPATTARIAEVAVSPAMLTGSSRAVLSVALDGDSGTAHVWALIIPPGFHEQRNPTDDPILNLPRIELTRQAGNRYEAAYDAFNSRGTYRIAVYAMDRGKILGPELIDLDVEQPLRRRAVLVAGPAASAGMNRMIGENIALAYDTLLFQGYTYDDIRLLADDDIPLPGDMTRYGQAASENVRNALTDWAAHDTWDLLLCMIGDGGDGVLRFGQTDRITADDLNDWLTQCQSAISAEGRPGTVTVVYDAAHSGSFIPRLAAADRILVAGQAEDDPRFPLSRGDASFSGFFWKNVGSGMTLHEAFANARNAMAFSGDAASPDRTPRIDDNGNGIANEKTDGDRAARYRIGAGIMLAGDDPYIGGVSISPESPLADQTRIVITVAAGDIVATGGLGGIQLWAVVAPPEDENRADAASAPQQVDLTPTDGNAAYQGVYDGFPVSGFYHVTVYARDRYGNVSVPDDNAGIAVYKALGPDVYEPNDTCGAARPVVVGDIAGHRTFHQPGDEDWAGFYGIAGQIYAIRIADPGPDCDPVIEIHDACPDGAPLDTIDDNGPGDPESRDWTCPADGHYTLRIRQHPDAARYGAGTAYCLSVYIPTGPFPGYIKGRITNTCPCPVASAVIQTDWNGSAVSLSDGRFRIIHRAGLQYSMTVRAGGYLERTLPDITVGEGGTTVVDVVLSPAGASPDCECADSGPVIPPDPPDDSEEPEPSQAPDIPDPAPWSGGNAGGCFIESAAF